MKKILVTLLLIAAKGFAQIDSTSLSFYPLATGNYWEYKETTYEGAYIYNEYHFYIQVIGDTLLNNGKTYKILKKEYLDTLKLEFCYERIDTATGNVFRYNDKNPHYIYDEYLIDSLKSAIGDTCSSQRLLHDIFTSRVILDREESIDLFNQKKLVRTFYQTAWVPGYIYQLAQKVGLVLFIEGGDTRTIQMDLQYAKINVIEYGEPFIVGITTHNQAPISFKLYQNNPNPFNNSTLISYSLTEAGRVVLSLYNIHGQKVTTIFESYEEAGNHTRIFYSNGISTGIYFIRLEANNESSIKKIILIR